MPRTTKATRPIINEQPYWLILVVGWECNRYRHTLIQEEQANLLSDFLPKELHFDEDGDQVTFDKRLRTEEGSEIARIIWEEIRFRRWS